MPVTCGGAVNNRFIVVQRLGFRVCRNVLDTAPPRKSVFLSNWILSYETLHISGHLMKHCDWLAAVSIFLTLRLYV